MTEKLLVTGLSGFVGQHIQVQVPQQWQLMQPGALDVLDSDSLDHCLAQGCPDAVIHLAGQTFVPESFRDPERTLQVNLLGTLNLLQALKRHKFSGNFLYVSSGDVYGLVKEDALPITEHRAPQPRNPYAVSKASAELLCQQWSYQEPWRIMVARPFNHIGTGQRADFVIPSVARQLALIKQGAQEPRIEVGDVDVTRDFLDVRDVISAYFYLLKDGQSGQVYNVCSGQELRIRDLINRMAGLAGLQVELVQDASRLRPSEQRRVLGSAQKLQQQTGWKPSISISESLQSIVSEWQERVVAEQ